LATRSAQGHDAVPFAAPFDAFAVVVAIGRLRRPVPLQGDIMKGDRRLRRCRAGLYDHRLRTAVYVDAVMNNLISIGRRKLAALQGA